MKVYTVCNSLADKRFSRYPNWHGSGEPNTSQLECHNATKYRDLLLHDVLLSDLVETAPGGLINQSYLTLSLKTS